VIRTYKSPGGCAGRPLAVFKDLSESFFGDDMMIGHLVVVGMASWTPAPQLTAVAVLGREAKSRKSKTSCHL